MLKLIALKEGVPSGSCDYEIGEGILCLRIDVACREGDVLLVFKLNPRGLQGLVELKLLDFRQGLAFACVAAAHVSAESAGS